MFGLPPPLSIDDLFVNWSKRGSKLYNSLFLTAASALCWTIWITRNEVVFDKCRPKFFLQVLFRGTYWLRQWAKLQRREELRLQLLLAGQRLETGFTSLVPMDDYRTDLLVSVCQDLFGVNFVILLDVLWPSKFLSWARVLDLVFVIIGLILSSGR